MVKAVVVRGSYTKVHQDGTREVVVPGQGDKSVVDVPEHHMETFRGVLVAAAAADDELRQVKAEGMQSPTPSGEATGGKSATSSEDAAPDRRKGR